MRMARAWLKLKCTAFTLSCLIGEALMHQADPEVAWRQLLDQAESEEGERDPRSSVDDHVHATGFHSPDAA